MTFDELLAEGRALQRRSWLLSANGRGNPIGIWHSPSAEASSRRVTVDLTPFTSMSEGYLSLVETSAGYDGEFLSHLPALADGDVQLFAAEAAILPPIDALFALGSDRVGKWLTESGWQRDWAYNENFRHKEIAEQYERVYQAEHPLYGSTEVFAVIGGWHFPFPDEDWIDSVADELLLTTLRDAEPWVEAWITKEGSLKVVERIT